MCRGSELRARSFDEAVAHDDHARDAAGRDEPARVGDRDAEREATAFDGLERRFRSHFPADRRGREVRELHFVSDRRLAFAQLAGERLHAGLLGEGDDARRRQHRNIAAADGDCGVALFDLERHRRRETGSDRHALTIGQVTELIDSDVLQTAIQHALRQGGEFAEVFVEDRRSSNGRFDDGRVEELVSGRDRGAGLRVVRGDTTGFAHTADLSRDGLLKAAEAAAGAARGGGGGTRVVPLATRPVAVPDASIVLPETVDKRAKVDILSRADAAAREQGGAITSVTASYADARRRIVVANSEGLFATDDRVRTRMSVQVVASGDTGMQTSHEAPGRTMGFELFDECTPEDVGRKAAQRALTLLDAVPAPSGRIPVVLKRGAGGVLFHEACGHGLEADHILKDASVFKDRVGEMVASPLVTLVDDGTYGREWGTIAIDDEGHPARRNVLIENGVLTDYMWDVVRCRKEGRAASGNGRRETYRHLPMPRMTNTFLLEGTTDPEDIIRGVDYGIYCVQLGGGQVDPATGDFVFGITEAYLIEEGEITRPIRAAQLIGNGPEVMRRVDAVGNDFDTWTGMCGKQGQSVPVSSGQPTVLVREMTVGGTAA